MIADSERTVRSIATSDDAELGVSDISSDATPVPPAAEVAASPPAAEPVSWLGKTVIAGLVHCACSHRSVHPDLLPFAGDAVETAVTPRAASDPDAT